MNILIVHDFYRIAGGEDSVVSNEIELLKAHGHKVYSYFKDNHDIVTDGIACKIGLFRQTVYNRKIKKEIQETIKRNRIEVVHCHNTFPLISPSVYRYSKQMGCKVFQTIHNFRFLCAAADFIREGGVCEDCLTKGIFCALKHKCYHGSFAQTFSLYALQRNFRRKKLWRYVDKFICLTEFNKEKLSAVIPEGKIAVKPNFSFFAPSGETCNGPKSQFIYVGRVETIKGIGALIDVFKREGMPRLVICGTGNDLERFKREAETSNIVFLGFCDKEKIMGELAKSIAMIMPSMCYEGFPMTVAESMAMGVPVIARNIGNLPYIVEDGRTGYLFDTDDDLERSVMRLNGDPIERDRLSRNCIHYNAEHLSPEANYNMLMDIYEGK